MFAGEVAEMSNDMFFKCFISPNEDDDGDVD